MQKETAIESLDVGDMRMGSLQENALRVHLQVAEDNPRGGNCMFYAFSHQLETIGMRRTPDQIRQDVVQYLREHPILQGRDGVINFENFIHGFSSWGNYLHAMSNDGEWGDNLILMGASNCYQVGIQIVSSLPNHDPLMISPVTGMPANIIHLGHIAEFHYVSLEAVTDIGAGLCPVCGELSDDNRCLCNKIDVCEHLDNITVLPRQNEIKILCPTTNDEILSEIVENLSSWLTRRISNMPRQNSGKLLLAQHFKSGIFNFLLRKNGIELSTAIIDDEVFYHTNNELMDIYDEFRNALQNQVNILMSGYVLIFVTTLVRIWILSLTRHLTDVFSYIASLILLNENDYDEMLTFINEQQRGGQENDNEDQEEENYMEE